jgi:hypothetical protein
MISHLVFSRIEALDMLHRSQAVTVITGVWPFKLTTKSFVCCTVTASFIFVATSCFESADDIDKATSALGCTLYCTASQLQATFTVMLSSLVRRCTTSLKTVHRVQRPRAMATGAGSPSSSSSSMPTPAAAIDFLMLLQKLKVIS